VQRIRHHLLVYPPPLAGPHLPMHPALLPSRVHAACA
jgi:hypothetical protein